MRRGSGNFLPLGLGYIISATEVNGFTVDVVNCASFINSFHPDDFEILDVCLRSALSDYSPLLIGVGPCITTQLKALMVISKTCKDMFPNTAIVCGGPLATMHDQEWVFFEMLGVDYIIKGDGEEAITNLLATLKSGKRAIDCDNVSYLGHTIVNEIADINNIRFPSRTIANDMQISLRRQDKTKEQITFPMITSRGCMYRCAYCVSGSLPYCNFRKRNYGNIINEMKRLKEEFGATDVIFYDDCFFYNPRIANNDIRDFCTLLLDHNINMSWQMELRTDLILSIDEQSIELLEEAGCRQINIGIEKTTDENLRNIGKTSSVRGLQERNKIIVERSNIQLTGTFILGGPGETEASTQQLISSAQELYLTEAHFSPLFLYPGTKLYIDMGYDARKWVSLIMNDTYPWGEIVYENEFLTREKLLDLEQIAYEEFYKGKDHAYADAYLDRYNLRR